VDLSYDLTEDAGLYTNPQRVHHFFFESVEQAVRGAAARERPGRILDLGSGLGYQAAFFGARGWESWALEPSTTMLTYARGELAKAGATVTLVRGIAEALPFKDGSFDRVICQGSLDHFADPHASVFEMARVLDGEGAAVIALCNYDSLSCRFGRLFALVRRLLSMSYPPRFLRYWEPPPTHTLRGSYRLVRRLGGNHLRMRECFGVSLLWLFPRWAEIADNIHWPLAHAVLRVLDRLARRLPAFADVIVSTWSPAESRRGAEHVE
jgi:ubiquinone/menaquinone biosynthesis C-methylase UbiE